MKKLTPHGFSAVEASLVLVVLGILGFTGWFVYRSQQATDKTLANSGNSTVSKPKATTPTVTPRPAANQGYLVVKEWGLRFKVPSGLEDVRYSITGDELGFFAKPSNSQVQYRSDYTKVNTDANGVSYFQYPIGTLYRSNDASKNRSGDSGDKVSGKLLGNHYYYTGWAFSSLATGAACVGLYDDSGAASCPIESTAFKLVNQGNTALLNTIELAQ